MNITNLPNDLINLLMDVSNGYKLMYVCNAFKNVIYKRLIKCDGCNKNVIFDNNELYTKGVSGCGHNFGRFLVKNIIVIKSYCIIQVIMTGLQDLTQISVNGKLIIDDAIRICVENKNEGGNVFITDTTDANLNYLKREYKINLRDFMYNSNLIYQGDISLICFDNRYTTNNMHLTLQCNLN